MRTLTIPAALLLTTVFAMGCGDQKSPTAVSEVELGPQFNMAPEEFTVPFSFPDFNPCTELEHTLSGELTVKQHIFANHANAVASFDVTSDDGFSGSAVQHITLRGTITEEGFLPEPTLTDVTNVNLSNDSGQRISLHLRFHVTIDGGVLRVIVAEVSSRCVGQPAA